MWDGNQNVMGSSAQSNMNIFNQHAYHEQMVRKFTQNASNKEYHMHFRVKKKLPPGQSVHILGGIPELGMWDKTKIYCRLVWTEGDHWITETPVITNKYYFQMKYATMDNASQKFIAYETGIDRLVDCEILDPMASGHYRNFMFNNRPGRDSKCVILEDIYEAFEVVFSVSHPVPDINDEMKLIG